MITISFSPPAPDARIGQILTAISTLTVKVDHVMATLADINTALARDEASEAKVLALLTAQAASLTDLAAQLATAIAGNDPVAMQAVVDKMNADADALDAAVAPAASP